MIWRFHRLKCVSRTSPDIYLAINTYEFMGSGLPADFAVRRQLKKRG
jgi:hypothetical protein